VAGITAESATRSVVGKGAVVVDDAAAEVGVPEIRTMDKAAAGEVFFACGNRIHQHQGPRVTKVGVLVDDAAAEEELSKI